MTKDEYIRLIDARTDAKEDFPFYTTYVGIMEHIEIDEDFRDIVHDCGNRIRAIELIKEYAKNKFGIEVSKNEINKEISRLVGKIPTNRTERSKYLVSMRNSY